MICVEVINGNDISNSYIYIFILVILIVYVPYISLEIDLKLYFETYGDENSYPIVLIHPLGGNMMIWEEEVRLILRSGKYRIIAYEIRGHYRSNMGKSDSFTMDDLAKDLDTIIKGIKN